MDALQAAQGALSGAQTAIMSHPLAQQVAEGIKSLQGQHRRVFGARLPAAKPAPRKVHMPPARPAPFAAIIPGDSVGEAVLTTGMVNFLQLYNTALIIRLVLTWFPNPPAFIVSPLSTITDPYLGLFRGIIPPIGGTLDLSPILAFVVLNFFTSTAEALPCEMSGGSGAAQSTARRAALPNPFGLLQPSRFQQAWDRRMRAQRAQHVDERGVQHEKQ